MMSERRSLLWWILFLLTGLLWLVWLFFAARVSRADTAIPTPAPPPGARTAPVEVRPLPTPSPFPSPGGGGETRIVQETRNYHYHNHQIFLSAETVSGALDTALRHAVQGDVEGLSAALGGAGGAVGAAFQAVRAGIGGDLEGAARGVFPVAAGLAVPLFLLRLALYHWARLTGDEDSPIRVAADWVAALVWAVLAGPVLARLAALGFEIAARISGDWSALAVPPRLGPDVIGMLILGPILNVLLGLGYIGAMAAMIWAIVAGYGILYLLAVLGPIAGVARAVPHLRWLSGLWLRGAVMAALLPVAAGAALRALGMAAGAMHPGSGLAEAVVRLVWAWGAVGFLFAMAGTVSRLSAGGAAEAVGGTVRAAKGIIGMAVLAAGTGGIGAAAAPAAGAAGAAAVAGGSGLAGARGLSMIAEGLRQEALGRTLGLPGLAAQGAWQRELGRAWMQAEQAADRLRAMSFFEERVAAPLEERLDGGDPTGETAWAFRRFLQGYRDALREARGLPLRIPESPEEASGLAARWQGRLEREFREAFRRRADAGMVGGETFFAEGRRAALRHLAALQQEGT